MGRKRNRRKFYGVETPLPKTGEHSVYVFLEQRYRDMWVDEDPARRRHVYKEEAMRLSRKSSTNNWYVENIAQDGAYIEIPVGYKVTTSEIYKTDVYSLLGAE